MPRRVGEIRRLFWRRVLATQQRLTEGQWQKTVEKMRKFGTPANDEESKIIVAYLARNWTPDLPPPRPVRAPLPPGSVPKK